MSDVELQLGASLVKSSVERESGDLLAAMPLKEKAALCFKHAHRDSNGWFVATDDLRFRIGCAALLLICSGEERAAVEAELRHIRMLNAAIQGIPVDWDALEELTDPVGLMGLYREARS